MFQKRRFTTGRSLTGKGPHHIPAALSRFIDFLAYLISTLSGQLASIRKQDSTYTYIYVTKSRSCDSANKLAITSSIHGSGNPQPLLEGPCPRKLLSTGHPRHRIPQHVSPCSLITFQTSITIAAS